ncbi:phage portal protein, lambda family [Pseudosulfitobacter pseudonitzschiae]|nr:phage portal protein [Pseudosulfitobacter pseudonitzschiae]SHG01571.1 phage portal protein, lambda family [Pseudosulfitobacter pseudonitzschiae]
MKHFSNASMFDRAVLAVAPMRGLSRIQAKAKAAILMNYDAAGNGRRVKGWKSPGTDADASSMAGRATLRQRSRDLIRNAPFAKRAQMVVTNNVVGAGIAPTITGTNKKAAQDAADVILPFLQSVELDAHRAMNFATMQSVVCNSLFESGEVLALRRTRPASDGATLPLAVEILEIDHLNSTIMGWGANEVRDGIEYNDQGIATHYHIYEQHPGAASRRRTLRTHRVPASDVLHIRRIDRPGQMRGVPWLAPVMLTLGEMRDYQEAQILKQKISALLAGVVEAGDGGVPEGASGLDALSPGSLVYTEAGQKVSFTTPPRVDDYNVVMRLGLWAVAMGIGITGESLSGDLSGVNFSSMRAGRLEMDKNIETWQEQILISQFCAGVGRWALEAYRLTKPGLRPLQMAWTAQRRALVDPTKEIPAIIKKVEAGLSSLSREQRAMGLDPDTVARERAEDLARNPAPVDGAVDETKKGKAA